MISDGAIRVGKLHFAGPVPDEGDYPTELEGKWGVGGTWIDQKLLSEGRKEEIEYMRKMGVFELVGGQDEGREAPFEIGLSGDQKGQGQR